MKRVTVAGKEYALRLDLVAMEQIEEAFGGMAGMREALRSGRRVRAIRETFKALASSGESYEGRETKVTGDEVMRLTVGEMGQLMEIMESEIMESSESRLAEDPDDETPDGAIIDDDDEDPEKNGRAGGR